jgi:hypothetical protein
MAQIIVFEDSSEVIRIYYTVWADARAETLEFSA